MKLVPPIHVLRAFEAVARLSSFSKAAAELHVTRSAISHRIQMLEEMLQVPVFARKPKMLRLTSSGSAYLPVVRKALEALDDVASHSGEQARKRRMTISTPPTFGRLVLMPCLADFVERHPDVEVSIELSMSQLDELAGEVDVDIRFGTGSYPAMESKLILRDWNMAVASPAYVERLDLQSCEDLSRAELLRSRLEPWKPWFTSAGLDWEEPRTGHRFEDLSLLYQAAADGLGVALARNALVQPWLDQGLVTPLFGIRARSPHAYYLVHRRGSALEREIATLADLLSAGEADAS